MIPGRRRRGGEDWVRERERCEALCLYPSFWKGRRDEIVWVRCERKIPLVECTVSACSYRYTFIRACLACTYVFLAYICVCVCVCLRLCSSMRLCHPAVSAHHAVLMKVIRHPVPARGPAGWLKMLMSPAGSLMQGPRHTKPAKVTKGLCYPLFRARRRETPSWELWQSQSIMSGTHHTDLLTPCNTLCFN